MAPNLPPPPPPIGPPQRYQQLRHHLELLKIVIAVSAAILMAAGTVLALNGIFSGSSRGLSAGLISGVSFIVAGFVGYLWSLVTIGAVEVLIDIEANTRR